MGSPKKTAPIDTAQINCKNATGCVTLTGAAAKAMWQVVSKLGDKRDQLWSHPDQLPSVEEISNPSLLLARLEHSGDDFDEGLRKLLDG